MNLYFCTSKKINSFKWKMEYMQSLVPQKVTSY